MDLQVAPATDSPARTQAPERTPLTVGLVQTRWHPDPDEHRSVLLDGVLTAAEAGAQVVFLPELTLSRYPADTVPDGDATASAEDLETGPTRQFAAAAAKAAGAAVHASLFEQNNGDDELGYNTAILVTPDGALLGRRRKTHIPQTVGYYEDRYFRPGPNDSETYAPISFGNARIGMPTCWDQWFPEVARLYALGGADLLAYPTAIGSEPDHPGFDTAPIWRHVIVGHGISNGLFMVVPNRWGDEGSITFYGSSFISDPYGRLLVEAPRNGDAVLVATLDLDQRRDWLTLFPFFATRRPETYTALT
ncbi:nitrilase-related carbon-nitrogen hydrolase [Cryptosporangium sp. NPDC048952]|uniref:nitrilase-related carbon-nitrogen hydrolase n=1 Tax=Cryptosporangium sp. NPDC048952 TaxID=3363961 RepID=UPI00371D6941